MPAGGRAAGSEFTTAYDSTVGMPATYYLIAAGFLLFIVAGVAKAFYDDKRWDGKVMKMISKGKQIQDQHRIVVRGARKTIKKT